METSLDLNAAPREVLLSVISQQQNTIAQLQRRIETLEGKAKPGGPWGMPGVKPKSGQRSSREKGLEKGPRKPRPHGFARQRMTPTHRVERPGVLSGVWHGIGWRLGAADPGSH